MKRLEMCSQQELIDVVNWLVGELAIREAAALILDESTPGALAIAIAEKFKLSFQRGREKEISKGIEGLIGNA